MTSLRRHLIFVYGTLKRGQPNHHYMCQEELGSAKFLSRAKTVQCWPLVVISKYNLPFLVKAEGNGKKVFGELYRVDDKMMKFLDEFEVHPTLYKRCNIQIKEIADNEESVATQECITYMLVDYDQRIFTEKMLENYDSKEHQAYDEDDEDLQHASQIYDS